MTFHWTISLIRLVAVVPLAMPDSTPAAPVLAKNTAPPWVQPWSARREFYVATNGGIGRVLRDFSGSGNDALKAELPTMQSNGIFARALELDGTEEPPTLTHGVCHWGTNYSIEAWIRTTSDQSDTDSVFPILGQWNALSRGGTGQAFGIDAGRITFLVSEGALNGCNDDAVIMQGSVINDGAWHHVVLTMDFHLGLARIYVDGVLDMEEVVPLEGCGVPPMRTLGGTGDWPYLKLAGALDEICVYQRVLSPADVLTRYNGGAGRPGEAGPGLVAGWHFDESFDESHPLSFSEARAGARPGDLFWMREGTYTDDFVLTRSGTAERPILYRARPGHRATLEGNLTLMADHVWVWGLELTDPNHAGPAESLLGLFGSGLHAINNVISEGYDKSGIGAWNFGPGQVVYGNLIYRTGRGPANPHGLYAQNNFADHGYKYIVQNMLLDAELVGPRRYNLHAYAECGNCGPLLSGFWIRGNVLRNGPALIGGFNEPVTDCVVEENYFYHTELQIGYRRPTQLVMTSNALARSTLRTEFFWGDGEILFPDRKPNVFRGNSLILPPEGEPHVRLRTSANLPGGRCDGCPPLSPIDEFDDNHYSAPFRGAFTAQDTNYGTLGFNSWTNLTRLAGNAFDSHSRVDAVPAGVQVVILPNEYEPGRAHLVIHNWDLEPVVELDLSAVVTLGDYFRIHDPTNFFGNPLRSGTYQGPVRLPTGDQEYLALVVTSAPKGEDTDGDGLPDNWEISFGFDPLRFSDTHGDIDHDGLTEYEEYIAGTDPNFEDSVLRLAPPTRQPGQATLRLPTVAGMSHRVEYSESLAPTDWHWLADLTGDGQTQQVVDDAIGESPRRYYRASGMLHPSSGEISVLRPRFELRFPTVPGRLYAVQRCEAATGTNWTTITSLPGDGTEKRFTDDGGQGVLARFYRVQVSMP